LTQIRISVTRGTEPEGFFALDDFQIIDDADCATLPAEAGPEKCEGKFLCKNGNCVDQVNAAVFFHKNAC